jgi:N-acetylglucosamine kinase-like BadF-type ATPase
MKKPRSLLSSLLLKKLNTATVWEAVNTVYAEGRTYIASFAPLVFEAYSRGDEGAIGIIDANAKALAELLNAGTGVYGKKGPAITSGGLFEHYGEVMTEHVGRYSDVRLITVDLPPIYGACRLACTPDGIKLSDDFYENFKKTYGGNR